MQLWFDPDQEVFTKLDLKSLLKMWGFSSKAMSRLCLASRGYFVVLPQFSVKVRPLQFGRVELSVKKG